MIKEVPCMDCDGNSSQYTANILCGRNDAQIVVEPG